MEQWQGGMECLSRKGACLAQPSQVRQRQPTVGRIDVEVGEARGHAGVAKADHVDGGVRRYLERRGPRRDLARCELGDEGKSEGVSAGVGRGKSKK